MGALGKLATLATALLLSGLAGACAPSTPDFPRAETAVPPPRATPRAPAGPETVPTFAVPTAAPGAVQTPGAAIRAVDEAPEVANLLSGLSALSYELNGRLTATANPDGIRSSARRAASLTAEASRLMPQMSTIQQEQAFLYEASLAEGLIRALAGLDDSGDRGPTVPEGTPEAAEGVLLDVVALPVALPLPPAGVLARDLARVQAVADELAGARPTASEVTVVLTSLQWRILAIRGAAAQFAPQEVQQLAAGAAAAMQAAVTLIEAHLG